MENDIKNDDIILTELNESTSVNEISSRFIQYQTELQNQTIEKNKRIIHQLKSANDAYNARINDQRVELIRNNNQIAEQNKPVQESF